MPASATPHDDNSKTTTVIIYLEGLSSKQQFISNLRQIKTTTQSALLEIRYRKNLARQSCKGSAVRIKGNLPKGKIGLKNRNYKKKCTIKKQKTASPSSSARASNSFTTVPRQHSYFGD